MKYEVIRKNTVVKIDGKEVSGVFDADGKSDAVRALLAAKYIRKVSNGKSTDR